MTGKGGIRASHQGGLTPGRALMKKRVPRGGKLRLSDLREKTAI